MSFHCQACQKKSQEVTKRLFPKLLTSPKSPFPGHIHRSVLFKGKDYRLYKNSEYSKLLNKNICLISVGRFSTWKTSCLQDSNTLEYYFVRNKDFPEEKELLKNFKKYFPQVVRVKKSEKLIP